MDALDIEKWRVVQSSPGKSVGVSSMLIALVMVGRAAFVFPLSFLSNLTKRSVKDKIGFKQVTIWWAGLMRGAVSVALAYNQMIVMECQLDQGLLRMVIHCAMDIVPWGMYKVVTYVKENYGNPIILLSENVDICH